MARRIPSASAEVQERPVYGAQLARRSRELAAAELARRQYGVIARGQLLACGVSRGAIARWAGSGRLLRLYRGVYAVGHDRLQPEGRRLAAVLACGPGAVLSHRSAAAHHGLRANARTRMEVTVPRSRGRGPDGIDVYTSALPAGSVTLVDGVPVTTVARTTVDMAAVLRPREVARAMDEAERLEVFDQRALDEELRLSRRGSGVVRTILRERHPESYRTKSAIEALGVEEFAARGLPVPEINAWLPELGFEVDLLWRGHGVTVEFDGWEFHRTRLSFEGDRFKTIELQAHGFVVMRITGRQLRENREWVIQRVGEQLACRPASAEV